MRRACRSSPLNPVARKTSTNRVISSMVCIRPPTEITLASLCRRASTAVSSFQASAARTPGTLLAAIASPLPEPPMTTPRDVVPSCQSVATPSAARRQKTG